MNVTVLLAAGSGTRLDQNKAKQFIEVDGKELFLYSLDVFHNSSNIDKIVLVTRKEDIKHIKSVTSGYIKLIDVIEGGDTRELSVKNAVDYLKDVCQKDDVILIHDSARPFVNERIINDNIEAVKKYDAAVTAIKATDSMFMGEDKVAKSLDRNIVWHAQTPQSFRFDLLTKAFDQFDATLTDDVAVVLNIGVHPHIVLGDKTNFKVTTLEDLKRMMSLLK